MEFPYLDSHTHAQFPAYGDDRDAVIARAREAGVRMVNVGTTRKTSEAAVALARVYPNLCYAAVGLHPIHTTASYHDVEELGGGEAARAFTSRGEKFDRDYYRTLAHEPSVVAIGECGLDYFRLPADSEEAKQKQREAFLHQIELAREAQKPLMIHCRAAFPDLLQLLTAHHEMLNAENPGLIHFFTGTPEEANDLAALGFSFTFGGVITFASDYDPIIRALPADRILSETDAPYVAPAPHRGKRNEPAYVVEVVKKLAELKEVRVGEMAERILGNAKRVFGI